MRWLDPRAVGGRLSFKTRTIYAWVNEGRVFQPGEVTRINGRVRIAESAVERVAADGLLQKPEKGVQSYAVGSIGRTVR